GPRLARRRADALDGAAPAMSDQEPPKRRWTGKPKGGDGARQMQTRVKNKKLDESSRNWMKRHLNDPYVARARADGYRARAAYKLIELDDQFGILDRKS